MSLLPTYFWARANELQTVSGLSPGARLSRYVKKFSKNGVGAIPA